MDVINTFLTSRRHFVLVCLLLAVGIAVRVLWISAVPSGLNQDEASIGYETYSVLTTGCDRNSNSYPVHFVSWGSGQNALYGYLSMPFISLFGLHAFSVRIVNAIFSCLSLLVFYLLFKLIFDKKKALVALGLLAICPWSIMAGRWGLESNIFPIIFLLGVFFLVKGIVSSQKYFLLSFLFFALSLYAYGTSYLILPLFFCIVFPYLIFQKKISWVYCLSGFALFLIVALPMVLFVLINHLDLPPIHILGCTIPRLLSNRTTEIFNLFSLDFPVNVLKNGIRLLNVLVLQTDGNEYNAIPSFGTIYPISFLFFLVGLFNVLRNKSFLKVTSHFIFVSWLFCSIVLGITSNININRINIIFFPLLYFVVLGLFDVREMLRPEFRHYYRFFLIGVYSLLFCVFVGYYFVFFREKIKDDFCFGLGDAIHYAEKISPTGKINVTTNDISMPYIYVCFYNRIDPVLFRQTVVYNPKGNSAFREVHGFGSYSFGTDSVSSAGVRILSKDEVVFNHFDTTRCKSFGNYYVLVKNAQNK